MYLHFLGAALRFSLQRAGGSAGVRRESAGGERCSVPLLCPVNRKSLLFSLFLLPKESRGQAGKGILTTAGTERGRKLIHSPPSGPARTRLSLNPLSRVLFLCLLAQREYFLPGPCASWMWHWKLHLGWSPLHQVYASHLLSSTLLCVPATPCRFVLHSLEILIIYHKDNILWVRRPSYDAQHVWHSSQCNSSINPADPMGISTNSPGLELCKVNGNFLIKLS